MVETTTIQVWPSGDMMRYVPNGNEFYERPSVAPDEWAETSTPSRPMTDDEWRVLRVALRAERIMREDVLTCQTGLVGALVMHADAANRGMGLDGFALDDIENLYPDPERMTAGEMREYVEERGGEVPDLPDDDDGACDALCSHDGPVTVCPQALAEADTVETYLDALRDAVRDCAEPAEVYEWWLVSGWLCGRLREVGEAVLDNGYGHWWGRQGTGQALIMDGVLQRVAEGMEA